MKQRLKWENLELKVDILCAQEVQIFEKYVQGIVLNTILAVKTDIFHNELKRKKNLAEKTFILNLYKNCYVSDTELYKHNPCIILLNQPTQDPRGIKRTWGMPNLQRIYHVSNVIKSSRVNLTLNPF